MQRQGGVGLLIHRGVRGSSQINRMDRLTFDGTRVTVFDFTGGDRTDTRTYWKGTGANDPVATTDYTFDAFGRLSEIRTLNAQPSCTSSAPATIMGIPSTRSTPTRRPAANCTARRPEAARRDRPMR